MYSVDLGLTFLAPVADILFSSRAWQNIFTTTKIHFTLSFKIKKKKRKNKLNVKNGPSDLLNRKKQGRKHTDKQTDKELDRESDGQTVTNIPRQMGAAP